MSRWEVPDGWEWVKAYEIADVIGGGTPPSKDPRNFSTDGIPWLTPADLTGYRDAYIGRGARDLSELGLSKSSARILPKGAVLFTSRAPIGYCAIASQPLATNQGFKSLVLLDGIAPEFLRHYLLASKDYAESLSSGTTFRELSTARMKELEIPLAPTPEQRRIVEKIEAFQERSRRAREALAEVGPLLEQFRQSVLAAAFRGDLTADWRAAHPNVEPASELLHRIRAERRRRWEQAELAKYEAKGQKPSKNRMEKYKEPTTTFIESDVLVSDFGIKNGCNWTVAPLELLVDPERSIPYGIVQTGEPVPNGIPVVRCGDIKKFSIAVDQLKLVEPGIHNQYHRTCLRGGEVLIAIRGTVGETAVVPETMKGMNISREVAMIPTLVGIEPRFLMYLLASPAAQQLITRQVKGVAQAGINLADLRQLPTPLPPQEEQTEIARRIDQLFVSVVEVTTILCNGERSLTLLDQAILAKAFRGELVPQDPSDELASVLLERIREQRAQQIDATKGNRKTSKTQRSGKMGRKETGMKSQRRQLTEVLTTKGQPMTPEQLLTESGYDDDSIEEFYLALRKEIEKGRIRENRPTESDVMLEAIKS